MARKRPAPVEEEEESSSSESDNSSNSDSSSDDSSDSSDEESEHAGRKKKTVTKKASQTAKNVAKAMAIVKQEKSKRKSSSGEEKVKKVKEMKLLDRLEHARIAFKWWEAEDLPSGIYWRKLEHAGIVFTPNYVRHNIPLLYDGVAVELTSEQEEIASFYAAMPDDGPQLGNPVTRKIFQDNFFADFKDTLVSGHVIKKFAKCDFSRIREHLDLQKSLRKAATEEEKAIRKAEKEQFALSHGYSLIDGRMEKNGSYMMEPPGLFRGRGEHPKTGCLKKRCFPESVSLNMSHDSRVPVCSVPGHAWRDVRHDNTVSWLSKWEENVQGQTKYMMLAASSSFKGKNDLDKYQKAIRLKGCIGKVRKDYTSKIRSKDRAEKQLGTAMWVIDILALRVGGEKGEDEADTVGCCSLRVEHMRFLKAEGASSRADDSYEIELEFLGKDSMQYKQTIDFADHGDLGKQVYKCLKAFCSGKSGPDEIFETLSPTVLNKHLTSLMPGLTAKVFRTFNASVTLEKELPTEEDLSGLTIVEKVNRYNDANRQVAILCNHQKTVSKAAETMFENLNEKLELLNRQKTELSTWVTMLKKSKGEKIPLKNTDSDAIARLANKLKEAQERKEMKNATDQQRLKAAADIEAAKAAVKQDQRRRQQEKHLYANTPSSAQVTARLEKWTEDIHKLELDIRARDDNKEVALGTSKINYMDPRISVAWCKRCEVPIDKIFAKTLRDKFNWAMAAGPNFEFK